MAVGLGSLGSVGGRGGCVLAFPGLESLVGLLKE